MRFPASLTAPGEPATPGRACFRIRIGAVLALAALGAAPALRAQRRTPTTPVQVQPGQTAPAPPARVRVPTPQIRRQVKEVSVPVTVRDPRGRLALDLGPEDFQIYDDGNLVHIANFGLVSEPPAVVLVVENSSRIAPLLPGIRKSGILFTNYVMGAHGKGAVLVFNDKSDLVVPFTQESDLVQKAISDLKPVDAGAHLYDALGRAVQMLEGQPENQQRVIVTVAESVDTGSLDKLTNVLQDAELANVSIYSIGLSTATAEFRTPPGQYAGPQASPPGTFARPGIPGTPQTPSTMAEASGNMNLMAVMEMLVKMGLHLVTPEALSAASAATGGDHFGDAKDVGIQDDMERIGSELHAEYMLSFQAPQDGPWGYHRITVKIDRPGYHLLTRPGYFLSPPGGTTTSGQ